MYKMIKGALFIELDAIRGLKRSVAEEYAESNAKRIIPPFPMGLGEQELLLPTDPMGMPVTEYAKKLVEQEGFFVYLFDQAPYIEQRLMNIDTYLAVANETIDLLEREGLRVAGFDFCPHAPLRQPVLDKAGNEVDEIVTPRCKCQFPGLRLLHRMMVRNEISRVIDPYTGHPKVLHAHSITVHKESQTAATDIGCSHGWNGISIINGSLFRKQRAAELMTGAHLTAAAIIKDHQSKHIGEDGVVTNLDALDDALSDVMGRLPESLNIPSGEPT